MISSFTCSAPHDGVIGAHTLDQRAPLPELAPNTDPPRLRVIKSTRCDGLINEYRNAA